LKKEQEGSLSTDFLLKKQKKQTRGSIQHPNLQSYAILPCLQSI
jgi:hypothetical protein